jgi:hypothetical protein
MMRYFICAAMLCVTSLSQAWADSRYVIRGGEVLDTQTRLTWARCSVGQVWEKEHCVGMVTSFNFDEAQKQAGAGWRVPTKDELVTLVNSERTNFPIIDIAAFPEMDAGHPWYWSATSNGKDIAWYVDFGNGYSSGFVSKGNPFALRLVKGGK